MQHTWTLFRLSTVKLLIQRWSQTTQAAIDIKAIGKHYEAKTHRSIDQAKRSFLLAAVTATVRATQAAEQMSRAVGSWSRSILRASIADLISATIDPVKLDELRGQLNELQSDHNDVVAQLEETSKARSAAEGQLIGLTAHLRAAAAKTHSMQLALSSSTQASNLQFAALRLVSAVNYGQLFRLWGLVSRWIAAVRWRSCNKKQQNKLLVPSVRALEAHCWRIKEGLVWAVYHWRATTGQLAMVERCRKAMADMEQGAEQTRDQALVELGAEFTEQHQKAHNEYKQREQHMRAEMENEKMQALQRSQQIFHHALEEVEQRARTAEHQLQTQQGGDSQQEQVCAAMNDKLVEKDHLLAATTRQLQDTEYQLQSAEHQLQSLQAQQGGDSQQNAAMNDMLVEKDRLLAAKSRQLQDTSRLLDEHMHAQSTHNEEITRWKAHCQEMSSSCDLLESRSNQLEGRLKKKVAHTDAVRMLCTWRGLASCLRKWRWRFQTKKASLALELSKSRHKFAQRQAYVVCSMYYVGALRIALVVWQQVVFQQFLIDKHTGTAAQEKASLRGELKSAQTEKTRVERQLTRISGERLRGKQHPEVPHAARGGGEREPLRTVRQSEAKQTTRRNSSDREPARVKSNAPSRTSQLLHRQRKNERAVKDQIVWAKQVSYLCLIRK